MRSFVFVLSINYFWGGVQMEKKNPDEGPSDFFRHSLQPLS